MREAACIERRRRVVLRLARQLELSDEAVHRLFSVAPAAVCLVRPAAFGHVECQANRWEMAQAIVEAGSDVCCVLPSEPPPNRTSVRERRSCATATPSPAWRTPPPKAWVPVDAQRAFLRFPALCCSDRAGLHVVSVPGSRAAVPGWHLLPAHRREGRLRRSVRHGRAESVAGGRLPLELRGRALRERADAGGLSRESTQSSLLVHDMTVRGGQSTHAVQRPAPPRQRQLA